MFIQELELNCDFCSNRGSLLTQFLALKLESRQTKTFLAHMLSNTPDLIPKYLADAYNLQLPIFEGIIKLWT